MSKLQSKLKDVPPQIVLRPCDIEFSKSFKNTEEGVMVRLKVSEVEIHIAPTTVHTVNGKNENIQLVRPRCCKLKCTFMIYLLRFLYYFTKR